MNSKLSAIKPEKTLTKIDEKRIFEEQLEKLKNTPPEQVVEEAFGEMVQGEGK